MEYIRTTNAPPALGHYEQGTITQSGLIYTAIQLPLTHDGQDTLVQPIETQTKQLITNITNIVIAGGGNINTILKVTLYLTDITHWDTCNKVYAEMFQFHKPARSVIQVAGLHKGYAIAMEAIAEKIYSH